MFPDYTSPFDGRHPNGVDSWAEFLAEQRDAGVGVAAGTSSYDAPFCALSAEACEFNSTTKMQTMCDDSGFGLIYRNNSCIFNGHRNSSGGIDGDESNAFDYSDCQLSNLSYPPTMATSDNVYFTDLTNQTEFGVTCGPDTVPLADWQAKYGQDLGSTIQPTPTADAIVAMVKRKLAEYRGAILH